MELTSIKDFLKEKELSESSLSRIWKQTKEHDSGTISAFRSARKCNKGERFTTADNKKNSKILKAKLMKAGYGVTRVDGTYIENYGSDNAIEVKEESYLVVDLKDTMQLKQDLMKFGEIFEQDSITFQKQTGNYYIISTNECPDAHPGKGKIGVAKKLGTPIFGKDGEFHSKVNGRPFVFESLTEKLTSTTDFYPTEIRGIIALAEENKI